MNTDRSPTQSRRHVAPFAAVAVASLPLLMLPSSDGTVWEILVASVLTVAIFGSLLLGLWERLPDWTAVLPPLLYCGVVALLRDAEGGHTSGYSLLLLIPVIWTALHRPSWQLATVLLGTVAALTVPILVLGDPAYPVSQWRRVAVWSVVAPVVGFTIQRLVATSRAVAAEAEARAEAVAAGERNLATVAKVVRDLTNSPDVRAGVCAAALQVSDALLAFIVEPDGEGNLVATATAGVPVPPIRFAIGREPSGSVVAFASRQTFFVPDAQGHPAVSQKVLHLVGGRSMLFEPIVRGDEAIGVLALVWGRHVAAISDSAATVIRLLAAEATVAIERADTNAELADMARTDPLTGLPNRREWEVLLERELARARRSRQPVALAMIDLDHFKAFNDTWGHQGGDRLLVAAAGAWRATLREIDVLARWGGEEFAVILPECSLDAAVTAIERLRDATPQAQTCSGGVAVWDGSESVDALLQRVDRALYRAKEEGRDRTVAAEHPLAAAHHPLTGTG